MIRIHILLPDLHILPVDILLPIQTIKFFIILPFSANFRCGAIMMNINLIGIRVILSYRIAKPFECPCFCQHVSIPQFRAYMPKQAMLPSPFLLNLFYLTTISLQKTDHSCLCSQIRPILVTVHTHVPSNGICRGFAFKYGKFPLSPLYLTALSVPKVPTSEQ